MTAPTPQTDSEWKEQFHATFKDALRLQNEIQTAVGIDKYIVGVFGSTIMKGEGQDIDLVVISCPDAERTAEDVASQIVSGWSSRLVLWLVDEYDEYVDVFANFITGDNLYVDLIVRGNRDASEESEAT